MLKRSDPSIFRPTIMLACLGSLLFPLPTAQAAAGKDWPVYLGDAYVAFALPSE